MTPISTPRASLSWPPPATPCVRDRIPGGAPRPTWSPSAGRIARPAETVPNYTWAGETAWADSGGGVSTYEASSPIRMIPMALSIRTAPPTAHRSRRIRRRRRPVCVYNSWDFGSSDPWFPLIGASLACPLWAGVVAVADQGRAAAGEGSLSGRGQTCPTSTRCRPPTSTTSPAAVTTIAWSPALGTPVGNLLVPGLAVGLEISTPAAASPNPVTTGTPVDLSVLGVESGSEPAHLHLGGDNAPQRRHGADLQRQRHDHRQRHHRHV